MPITDLSGEPIIVTDLSKAIEQARLFAELNDDHQSHGQHNMQRKKYWEDMLQKLQKLESKQVQGCT